MSAEKTLAIVLRVIDFSESSCVVTLFTRDFGKIAGLAKGARRPKGPFESALDLLSTVRIVFLRKSSDALHLLTEAKLERRFRAAAKDLARLYAGYYVLELLLELTHDEDPNVPLFDDALRTIAALDGDGHVPSVVLRFEFAALHHLGQRPTLTACAACGEEIEPGARIPFGLNAGGVLCGNCRFGQRTVVSLSRAAWEALVMEEARFDLPEGELPERIVAAVSGEIRGLMNQYMNHLLGHRPKMQAYFGLLNG